MAQLEQGLQGMESNPENYLTMENFSRDFGPWYGNDDGLGNLLFDQMAARGLNTKPMVEAALRATLEETIKQCNALMSRFSGFLQMQQSMAQQQAMQGIQLQAQVQQTLNETQNVANAVNTALAMQGVDTSQMPADMTQPDGMPAEQPPMEPPAEPPAEQPPAGTTSDARVKNIKGPSKFLGQIVSDRKMKNVKPAVNPISASILAACRAGF